MASDLEQAIEEAALGAPESDGQSIVRSYRFTADSAVFRGHFPGYPVLPGIVQLLAACRLAGIGGAGRPSLKGVDTAKFQRQLRPGDLLRISCRPADARPGSTIQARVTTDDDVQVSSFILSVGG